MMTLDTIMKRLTDVEPGGLAAFTLNEEMCQEVFALLTYGVACRDKYAAYIKRDGDEETLVEGQISDLLEGMGASEDHENVLKFLRDSGLNEKLANRVHRAIVNAEKGNVDERPSNPVGKYGGGKFEPDTAIGILGRAQAIQEQRAKDYDQPAGERSMGRTVDVFNIITRRNDVAGHGMTESEGWLFMQILKDVRDRSTARPHRDSLEDCTSYSALKAESRLKE